MCSLPSNTTEGGGGGALSSIVSILSLLMQFPEAQILFESALSLCFIIDSVNVVFLAASVGYFY
jgi:hypothetical protein